jgi:hypothetical protein
MGEIGEYERGQLQELLTCLEGRDASVQIEGDTCRIGSQKINDRLALKRAEAVGDYLAKHAVRIDKFSGEGKKGYISGIDRLNRRVVIHIIPKKGEGCTMKRHLSTARHHSGCFCPAWGRRGGADGTATNQ